MLSSRNNITTTFAITLGLPCCRYMTSGLPCYGYNVSGQKMSLFLRATPRRRTGGTKLKLHTFLTCALVDERSAWRSGRFAFRDRRLGPHWMGAQGGYWLFLLRLISPFFIPSRWKPGSYLEIAHKGFFPSLYLFTLPDQLISFEVT